MLKWWDPQLAPYDFLPEAVLDHSCPESLLEDFVARLTVGKPSTINELIDNAVCNAHRILADLLEDRKIHHSLSGLNLFPNVTVLAPFKLCEYVQALKRKLLEGLTPNTCSERACTSPWIRLDVKLHR